MTESSSPDDIEDVLSSIRRLVSDTAPASAARGADTDDIGGEDRLVLTPALRVTDPEDPYVRVRPPSVDDDNDEAPEDATGQTNGAASDPAEVISGSMGYPLGPPNHFGLLSVTGPVPSEDDQTGPPADPDETDDLSLSGDDAIAREPDGAEDAPEDAAEDWPNDGPDATAGRAGDVPHETASGDGTELETAEDPIAVVPGFAEPGGAGDKATDWSAAPEPDASDPSTMSDEPATTEVAEDTAAADFGSTPAHDDSSTDDPERDWDSATAERLHDGDPAAADADWSADAPDDINPVGGEVAELPAEPETSDIHFTDETLGPSKAAPEVEGPTHTDAAEDEPVTVMRRFAHLSGLAPAEDGDYEAELGDDDWTPSDIDGTARDVADARRARGEAFEAGSPPPFFSRALHRDWTPGGETAERPSDDLEGAEAEPDATLDDTETADIADAVAQALAKDAAAGGAFDDPPADTAPSPDDDDARAAISAVIAEDPLDADLPELKTETIGDLPDLSPDLELELPELETGADPEPQPDVSGFSDEYGPSDTAAVYGDPVAGADDTDPPYAEPDVETEYNEDDAPADDPAEDFEPEPYEATDDEAPPAPDAFEETPGEDSPDPHPDEALPETSTSGDASLYASLRASRAAREASELEAEVPPAPGIADEAFDADQDDDLGVLDEEALRELVAQVVREELQGALGQRITRNVRKMVRREIRLALAADDFD
ncbi:MAG: hypothetical protein AAF914_03065 [Pseudomonadota bacterium]